MGKLIDGIWQDIGYETEKNEGQFKREESQFRHQVAPPKSDPQSNPFVAEANRYHLYVSYACPWAHRTLIMCALKKLEEIITVDVVHPHMLKNGWQFKEDYKDSLYQSDYLYQIYLKAEPQCTTRVTVPVLWDKKTETIVNNESSEIIRIFNEAFAPLSESKEDYYPLKLHQEIDTINEFVYKNINNGVYRCGFATTQSAYEKAAQSLFKALDELEKRLSSQKYLIENQLTEADIRLFTTLIRYDPVYYVHFKCNRRLIKDYPNLSSYLKRLLSMPAFKETVHMDHIKQHYYYSHEDINPHRIVPLGPELDWS